MHDSQTPPMPRRLLAQVRDVMAGSDAAAERLDKVVAIIADEMAAEVCSVYVRRAGDLLELFATRGLKSSAVHITRLRIGEGLIGNIAAHARPLALAEAQDHPSFAFRPETGEEIYHSLMGVPVLRGGRVIGVVAVQNRTRRNYSDEEIEALQIVAMVLAEVVAGGELISRDELLPGDGNALLPLRLEGMRFNSGIGSGIAVLHRHQMGFKQLIAENPDQERQRLRRAFADMHGALDALLETTEIAGAGEPRDVLEAYRMIAKDSGWLGRIDEAVAGGLTAEAAVKKVHINIQARMSRISDPYLRDRVHDMEDLANRLLHHLSGGETNAATEELPQDVVLVARTLGPVELLDYDPARLRGLVLEEGTPTSHAAIVARALDIPVIGRAKGVLGIVEQGDPIIVDGDNAQIFIRPGEEVRQKIQESIKARDRRKAGYARIRDLPAVTLDGKQVSININAGLLVDMQHLKDSGADGIGLYRTEIPFMVRADFPGVEEQRRLYAKVLDHAAAKPVVFRTLDVGGEKILPYWGHYEEENPAMGWRAIRISIDRPSLLRQQLRALIRAASGGELRVMFPMITEMGEFDAARSLLDMEMKREEEQGGVLPEKLKVGATLEVPALVFQLPALLEVVDFISIGSNDLFQFMFACDRGNPRISERYDILSPFALSFLRSVLDQCRAADIPVSLCGEAAGRPLEAMALIGMGFDNISLTPPAVGPVKTMVRSLNAGPLGEYMETLYDLKRQNVREKLKSYAIDHGVMI